MSGPFALLSEVMDGIPSPLALWNQLFTLHIRQIIAV